MKRFQIVIIAEVETEDTDSSSASHKVDLRVRQALAALHPAGTSQTCCRELAPIDLENI